MLKIVCIPLKWLINLICFGMTPSRVKDVKESLLQTLEGVYKGVPSMPVNLRKEV